MASSTHPHYPFTPSKPTTPPLTPISTNTPQNTTNPLPYSPPPPPLLLTLISPPRPPPLLPRPPHPPLPHAHLLKIPSWTQFADPGVVALLLAAIRPVPEWAEPRFPAHPHDHHSRAAAASCLPQILQSGPDARAVPAAPDDYCFVLHELGDRDKHPPKALAVFHSLQLMRGPVDQGKLLTAAIGGLGKMARPCPTSPTRCSTPAGYGNTVFTHSALISAYAPSGLAAEAVAMAALHFL